MNLMAKRAFLPPADALIAFECAARHESFTRAAEELHLTQGAISKQIRHLEQRLGVPLFARIRQRVVLTDAGRLYLHEVRSALDQLGDATRQVMSFAGSADVLNLAVLPTFGARWLAPRLAEFLRRTPKAALNFSIRLRPFDFTEEPFRRRDPPRRSDLGGGHCRAAVSRRIRGRGLAHVPRPAHDQRAA